MVTHCYCSKAVSPYKDMAHVLRLLHLHQYRWESWNHWKGCSGLTDWREPIAVLSTRILHVNVMKSWAVPRWKKLMLDRSNPLCRRIMWSFSNPIFSNINLRINPYLGLYSLSNSVCNHFLGSRMHRIKNLSLVIFYLEKRSFRFAFEEDIYGEEFHFGQILNLKHRRLNHKVCAERFGLKTELEGKCMAFQ